MRKIEIDLEVHRLIENERCSFEESENAIVRRLLGIDGGKPSQNADQDNLASAPRTGAPVETAIPIGSRTTGNWAVIWDGQSFIARNLREAYLTGVAKLAEFDDTLFAKLTKEGGSRRRYVASSARDLYPHSPHLANPERHNSHQLGQWHIDLNLSRAQAAKRIRRAAALAGVRYGEKLTIKDGLSPL